MRTGIYKREFPAAILEREITKGIVRRMIADTETGELMATEWRTVPVDGVFPENRKATILPMLFSRDVTPDGAEVVYIKHVGDSGCDEVYRFWRRGDGTSGGKTYRRTRSSGNKPEYVKVYVNKLVDKIGGADIGFLMQLSSNVSWDDGLLVSKRGKKPLGFEEMAKIVKSSKATVSRRVSALIEAGVLKKSDGGYLVNREYLAKG